MNKQRIKINLPEEIQNIKQIWLNPDEQLNTLSINGDRLDTCHLKAGDVIVGKTAIRINDDLTWTMFYSNFMSPADAIIKHGLVLDEETAKKIQPTFSKLHKYPYKFEK